METFWASADASEKDACEVVITADGMNHLTVTDMRQLTNPFLVRPEPANAPNMAPASDIRPTTQQWVIREAEDGSEAVKMRWGLVPYWFKGPTLKEFKLTTFNAKSETVATAASFKGPFARRRCLVAADGWYEWTGAKGAKQRHLFTPKHGGALTFTGLWERWKPPEGDPVESFTIVTQPAGAPLNAIHDRAPVVIWQEDRKRWLSVNSDVTELIGPESADRFDVRPIFEAEVMEAGNA